VCQLRRTGQISANLAEQGGAVTPWNPERTGTQRGSVDLPRKPSIRFVISRCARFSRGIHMAHERCSPQRRRALPVRCTRHAAARASADVGVVALLQGVSSGGAASVRVPTRTCPAGFSARPGRAVRGASLGIDWRRSTTSATRGLVDVPDGSASTAQFSRDRRRHRGRREVAS